MQIIWYKVSWWNKTTKPQYPFQAVFWSYKLAYIFWCDVLKQHDFKHALLKSLNPDKSETIIGEEWGWEFKLSAEEPMSCISPPSLHSKEN